MTAAGGAASVQVNEVGIFATRRGLDWWPAALAPWEASARAACLGLTPGGGVWFLPGGSRQDAAWMRDHIASHGVPRKFVTVTTAAKAMREKEANQ